MKKPQNGAKKILIAEDEKFILNIYSDKFEKEGFLVEKALDGEEAWKKVQANPPDVLLLDVLMPKMNGLQVLNKVKQDPKLSDVIVVVLTNIGEREYIDKALNEGANEFLVKASLEPADVVDEVRRRLDFKAGEVV